jgi:hypothetical protein
VHLIVGQPVLPVARPVPLAGLSGLAMLSMLLLLVGSWALQRRLWTIGLDVILERAMRWVDSCGSSEWFDRSRVALRGGMRCLVATLAIALCPSAHAKAPLFELLPICPDQAPPAFAVVEQWLVRANVRGVALVQHAVLVPVPRRPDLELHVWRFEPLAGFIPGGSGVIPDPHLPDSALSYSWYGFGDGGTLTLAVRDGRVSATLRTADWISSLVETTVGTVFRILDPQLFPPPLGNPGDGAVDLRSPSPGQGADGYAEALIHCSSFEAWH